MPTPEGGLFGLPDPAEASTSRPPSSCSTGCLPRPGQRRPGIPTPSEDEDDVEDGVDLVEDVDGGPGRRRPSTEPEEALQAPKVPAALPMRRRRPPQSPIRTHGSGEWLYADPPAREPLARASRQRGAAHPAGGARAAGRVAHRLPAAHHPRRGRRRRPHGRHGLGVTGRRHRACCRPGRPLQTPGASSSPSPTPEPRDPHLHGQAGRHALRHRRRTRRSASTCGSCSASTASSTRTSCSRARSCSSRPTATAARPAGGAPRRSPEPSPEP